MSGVFGTLRGLLRRRSTVPAIASDPALGDGYGVADLVNLSSALKSQHESDTRAKRLPLEQKLAELLDKLHETELELRLIDLLLATLPAAKTQNGTGESATATAAAATEGGGAAAAASAPPAQSAQDAEEQAQRFQQGLKDLTDEFLRGFEDLLNQRDGVVENGRVVALDKSKRAQLLAAQRNNIEQVLRRASSKLQQLTNRDELEGVQKRRTQLMEQSEKLFEEKNDLTMQMEGNLSEELREKQKAVEEQKRKLLSSNLLLVCERGDLAQATVIINSLDANKTEEGRERKTNVLFQRDRDGNTVALRACSTGSLPLVKLLYQAGAPLDIANNEKQTVLHVAAQNGNPELLTWLLRQPEWTLAPPPTTNVIDAVCSFGRTPLHYAAFNGNVDAVDLLLNRGANVNATLAPPQLFTPLHNAVLRRHADVVRRLLEQPGLDLYAKDGQGWTALHCAVSDQSEEIVKLLVSRMKLSDDVRKEYKKLAKSDAIAALLGP